MQCEGNNIVCKCLQETSCTCKAKKVKKRRTKKTNDVKCKDQSQSLCHQKVKSATQKWYVLRHIVLE